MKMPLSQMDLLQEEDQAGTGLKLKIIGFVYSKLE